MIKLTTFLDPKNIQYSVVLSSKKRLLELIGKIVAEALNRNFQGDKSQEVCPIECFSNLFKREKLGSTAINNGVALPHAKLPVNEYIKLDKPIAIFLQLDTPIDYESQDNKEVDLVYAILFPEQNCEQYRGWLQEIALRLSDKNLLKHLRAATSVDELWQVLTYADIQVE